MIAAGEQEHERRGSRARDERAAGVVVGVVRSDGSTDDASERLAPLAADGRVRLPRNDPALRVERGHP